MSTFLCPSGSNPADAVWVDLVNPTDEERARVAQATQLWLPSRSDIEEIESSSRVYVENEALYLSSPVLESANGVTAAVSSVGFVLSRGKLVTLRFGKEAAFDAVIAFYSAKVPISANDVFLKILETIVDGAADALERASAELEKISHSSFHSEFPKRKKVATQLLRDALRKLGRIADGISHIRDMLLGIKRIAAFVRENHADHLSSQERSRLEVVRDDIGSLVDYQSHLSNKVQFLLDATLGFISIEQNDVVKTLTVVSVVGVPPVLIAGIYGMNFKHMPELDWSFGYPFSLGLMVMTALLPLVWFKWRGWI